MIRRLVADPADALAAFFGLCLALALLACVGATLADGYGQGMAAAVGLLAHGSGAR